MRGGTKLAEGRTAKAALAGARGRPSAGTALAGTWQPSRAAAAARGLTASELIAMARQARAVSDDRDPAKTLNVS
ncbi:hypothetical protein ACU4GR_14775 [Methylobacterium oryzae CBMB20]